MDTENLQLFKAELAEGRRSQYLNPATGKKLSGAQIRKLKRQRANNKPGSLKRMKESLLQSCSSLSDVDIGVKMAIIHQDYPETLIGEEQANSVKTWLLQQIDGSKSTTPLRFHECSLKGCALYITCFDEATRQWLEKTIPIFEGAQLRLVEADKLPQPVKTMVWIPGPIEDAKKVIRRMSHQNSNLQVDGWQILSQNTDANGQLLVIRMDKRTWDRMGEELQHSPFLNFGRVDFLILADPEAGVTSMEATTTSVPELKRAECSTSFASN